MVKINLLWHDITFEIITSTKRNKKIIIKNGVYDNKHFSSAIIVGNAVILEGDENLLIENEACAVYITITTVRDKLADMLQDNTIYLSPDEAIPEGRERELLLKLISG